MVASNAMETEASTTAWFGLITCRMVLDNYFYTRSGGALFCVLSQHVENGPFQFWQSSWGLDWAGTSACERLRNDLRQLQKYEASVHSLDERSTVGADIESRSRRVHAKSHPIGRPSSDSVRRTSGSFS